MANSIKAAAARGARGLLVLLAAFGSPLSPSHHRGHRLLVSASTTTSATSTTTEGCDGDAAVDACNADADCAACFSGWGAVTSSTTASCEDRFPSQTSLCEQTGAEFCCNLGDEATANTCMRSSLFVTFLGCFMEGFQCSIEDMPCFDGSVFTGAPTPSPTPAGNEQPTASPTTTSSYEDRGFEMTASPTSSTEAGVVTLPIALVEACAEEAAACVADEACQQGCISGNLEMVAVATSMDSESYYSTCQLGYLLGEETSSGGSNSTVCDVVSSAFCCSGSGAVAVDADEELGCATNEAAQELWSCAFEFYECSVEDATCTGDGAAGVNSAPGRLLPGGGGYSAFGVFNLSCWVSFVLGLVAVEI